MGYIAETGVGVPMVSAEQMREIDRIAVEETGPNLFQMMEHAGRSLAELAIEHLGRDWQKRTVLVLAGAGGNGGGGICAARHLANRGARVVVCLADADHLAPVPAFQREVFRSTSGREIRPDELEHVDADLILDALVGYSLIGPPRGTAASLIRWTHHAGVPIVALDVPSGLSATTGEVPGDVVRPDVTLTLALPKTGLRPPWSGGLVLADLGIPSAVFRRLGLRYENPFDHRFRVPLRWEDQGCTTPRPA